MLSAPPDCGRSLPQVAHPLQGCASAQWAVWGAVAQPQQAVEMGRRMSRRERCSAVAALLPAALMVAALLPAALLPAALMVAALMVAALMVAGVWVGGLTAVRALVGGSMAGGSMAGWLAANVADGEQKKWTSSSRLSPRVEQHVEGGRPVQGWTLVTGMMMAVHLTGHVRPRARTTANGAQSPRTAPRAAC